MNHNRGKELALVFCIIDLINLKIMNIVKCLRKVILKYSQSIREEDFRTQLFGSFTLWIFDDF